MFLLCVAFIWVMEQKGYSMKQGWWLSLVQVKEYFKEFYHYSHPLFIYALVGLIVGILDRWLLQFFSGSVQQGFFGLSYQIGTICFLFTSAMSPLLLREFSIAFGKKDLVQMATLFRRYVPMLYSIAAYFGCFIAMQADKVIYIFGGNKYKEAVMAVTIMAFYPIHQTYGQLSGSVFYATGQTGLYRNIGITFMLIGLPVTYFLIAPQGKMGLDIGATGLAIKMVSIQFVAVNVQLYFNTKLLKLSFSRFLGYQVLSVVCMISIAVCATFGVDKVLGLHENIIPSFLLAGVLYTVMVIGLVYCVPVVAGLHRQDIQSVIHLGVKKIWNR
jgi:O-antigen/teichoic acid export membrane protein